MIGRRATRLDTGDRRHDLPWCAKTALKSIAIDERLLHPMQRFFFRDAFHGQHAPSVDLGGEHHASVDMASVDMDRARAALTEIATFLRSGQAQPFSQNIEQRLSRIDR